jgi:hypothetical protein
MEAAMRGTAREWAWTVLVLLAASTMAIGNEEPVARQDLIVRWSDPQQCVPEAVRLDLFRETAALFARWGVRLSSSEGLDSDGSHDVRVVLLDQVRLDGRGTRILGETHARPLEFPAVWILVPNVRAMLEQTERGATPHLLARALALVTAHEVLHVLAPGLRHASHGLMRPGLAARDLTRPSLPVNNAFRRALLDSVRQPPAGQAGLGRP